MRADRSCAHWAGPSVYAGIVLETRPAADPNPHIVPEKSVLPPPLSDRQRAILRDLLALVADRSSSEAQIEQTFKTTTQAAESAFQQTKKAKTSAHETATAAGEKAFRAELQRIESEFDTEYGQTEREFKTSLAKIAEKAEVNEVATKKALQEAIWLTETVFEATEAQPIEQFQQARKGIDGKLEELRSIEEKTAALLKRYRQRPPADLTESENTAPASPDQAPTILDDSVNDAQSQLDQIMALFIPRLFQGLWPIAGLILVVLISIGVMGWLKGWGRLDQSIGTSAAIGLGASIVLFIVFYLIAKSQVGHLVGPMRRAIAAGRGAAQQCLALAQENRDRQKAVLVEKRDRDLNAAHNKYEPVLFKIEHRRKHHLERINEKYPKLLQELKQKRDADNHSLTEGHQKQFAELKSQFERDSRELHERYTQQNQESLLRYQSDWSALEMRWKTGMARVYATIDEINRQSAQLFPQWDDSSWRNWSPPTDFAPVIRFGQMHVDLKQLPGGVPQDQRLMVPGPTAFNLPSMLAFPDLCSMLIQAGAEGRDEAVQTLQTVMFRLLTTLPPGKVRFTIIDPVGLGQNFAGFMHLADYEGAFVADKIWTEDRHIEQRLLDLTEHMENVIQKYLRNEYETIGDYNVDAGEIAEPFRFLVVANFPVNFSETAARRLASIINSGARCGVYTLITADTRQPLPMGIQMGDLERNCVRLVWDSASSRIQWKDPDYEQFPLALDAPPQEDFVTQKLHIIGRAAKESTRVEVPFDIITPSLQDMWTGDTSSDLRVALGRAGATKLQYLTLGVGTSQHALIAGKTGSGKSTLLHAMITNLSLWYSPQEVEFYLVDFKKGVEFKTYAIHQLPHARAVAIESDREFGLSVLQRLDSELKHRGNLYRDLGVQDLAGYRRVTGGEGSNGQRLPRTLLIIDEFQELFVEDDKLAQDAALLLDRLVRQGRAFGMHVLLGSQTLGGAYSLARSTIGQMAVRIALQCSEADSYLILSDDNAAARLLSRPGEAIYNDASGMVEGNNPFQIVWLPDDKREECLERIQTIATAREYRPPEPQIVFEGNVPADIARNHLLGDLLDRPTWPQAATGPAGAFASAWLGEAIAIKDPTAAVFRRQSGNNLIIVGQREESSLAMLATSLLSLAAQHAPANANFYILDGSPVDAPTAGYMQRLSGLLPHSVQNVSWRDVPTAMTQISEELERRQQANESDAPAIYILIYGLQRFRMLRQEDDFGFTSSDPDAPARPEKQFAAILREGPHLGIHTLAWCDTVNNLNRSLDRQGLKEFEIRVLFQMGAADSSNLIDSPLASKLGLHRALFFSEEQGHLEKFRPYALPDEEWLAHLKSQFAQRAESAKAASGNR